MEFRLEGRRRRSVIRVNSFRDHSRISLHSPEYSRRLDCHVSTSHNKLSLRGGWVPWRGGWLCIEWPYPLETKIILSRGREIKKKRRRRRRKKEKWADQLAKLPKPLDNGEDIFSNEPRRVHSSANYTSTTFSVFLLFYLTSVISKPTKRLERREWRNRKGRGGDGLPPPPRIRSMLKALRLLLPLPLLLPPLLPLFRAIKRETRKPAGEISQTINSKTNLKKTKKLGWSASETRRISLFISMNAHLVAQMRRAR